MQLEFASADELATNFRTTVVIGTFVTLALLAVFTIRARAAPFSMSFASRCVIAIVILAGFLWYDYSSTHEQFVSLTIDPSDVRLRYAGLYSRDTTIPRVDITGVRFGAGPGHGRDTCRISLEVRGTEKFFSAWIPDRTNNCRTMRDQILRELGR